MEPDEKQEDEVRLTIEQEGNRKWLCVDDQGFKARVRLPLHIEHLTPDEQAWHMKKLCDALRDKLAKVKRKSFGIVRTKRAC